MATSKPTREQREAELRLKWNTFAGKDELTEHLRKLMKVPEGTPIVGIPTIQKILEIEYGQ